jgi:hypothetical protein
MIYTNNRGGFGGVSLLLLTGTEELKGNNSLAIGGRPTQTENGH